MDIPTLEKPVVGIALVMMVTELIMRLTPERFDKRRYAIPISILVAVLMCIADTFIYGSGLWYVMLWEAGLKGFIIAMASGGAYSALKNYKSDN